VTGAQITEVAIQIAGEHSGNRLSPLQQYEVASFGGSHCCRRTDVLVQLSGNIRITLLKWAACRAGSGGPGLKLLDSVTTGGRVVMDVDIAFPPMPLPSTGTAAAAAERVRIGWSKEDDVSPKDKVAAAALRQQRKRKPGEAADAGEAAADSSDEDGACRAQRAALPQAIGAGADGAGGGRGAQAVLRQV